MKPPESPVLTRRLRLDRVRVTAIATGVTLLILAEALARRNRPPAAPPRSTNEDSVNVTGASDGACPPGTLQDDALCIPLPALTSDPEPERQRLGLLPGRSANYADYETPISGAQAREASDGRGAFVAAPAGTRVRLIELEAQEGSGEPLSGDGTVAPLTTLHRVRRAQALRHYLLVYGGARALPGDDSALGVVDAPATGAAGLTLWVRQLRHGVDPARTPISRLLEDSHSLDCDPRNVLPTRGEP